MTLQKHTTAPVQCVTSLDVHIKAGSGRIVLLPNFVLRSPQFVKLQSTATRGIEGDHRDNRASQQALCDSSKTETASGNLPSSPDGQSSIKACHMPPTPSQHSSSQASPTESQGRPQPQNGGSLVHWHAIMSQEPTVQSLILFAWARIVVEMYLRDEAVGEWSLKELRAHLNDEAVCPDARPTLDACTDPVRALHT